MFHRKNLLVAPHPDDECLAAYGLMSQNPKDWKVVIVTNGDRGLSDNHPELNEAISGVRCNESLYNLFQIGLFDVYFLYYSEENLCGPITEFKVREIARHLAVCDSVYVPHPKDGHEVHRAVSDIVGKAYAFVPPPGPRLWYYCINTTVGESLGKPDFEFVLLPEMYQKKREAILRFRSQDHFLLNVFGRNYYRTEKFWEG